jgi:hypothetical protein
MRMAKKDGRIAPNRAAPRLVVLAALSIVVGAALRFAWPADMEFKGDERYMFDRSQLVGAQEPWPGVGMPSGVGLRNPGASVWLFVALARLLRVTTPPGLALAVIGLNVAALALLFVFAMTEVDERERDAWLWAVALVAVNPLAVLVERKIWAQSVLPLPVLLFWIGWWRRERWGRTFTWGFVGALLGQIHMSGFFLAASVFAWEFLSRWRGRDDTQAHFRRPRWDAWLVGSIAGALPMIPWVTYVLHAPASAGLWRWREVLTPNFWIYGLTDALGLGLHYNLGLPAFFDFLRSPWLGGMPTFVVAIAHAVIVIGGSAILAPALARAWRRQPVWRTWLRAGNTTGLALRATLLGYGVLLTLSGVIVYRHYLVVTFPFEWVFLAGVAIRFGKKGPYLLGCLWGSQLVITAALLLYIHVNVGAPGDYGVAYRRQAAAAVVTGRTVP